MAQSTQRGIAVLLAWILLLTAALPGRAEDTVILAEKVAPSELAAGDRIVIVHGPGEEAVSLDATGTRLAPAEVTLARTATRQVLTVLPENTAVFQVLDAGDGEIFLRCGAGYLTSGETGNQLFFTAQPSDCSRWQFWEEQYLYNPYVVYQKDTTVYRDYFLEYYAGGNCFSTYGKRGADNTPYIMHFYRLGDSRPGEALVRNTGYALTVFETSDVHGYLAETSGGRTGYLLAAVSEQVNRARGGRRDRVILLDGGDIFCGHTVSNLLHGHPLSAAYAMMGYDAVALGNHEFDWGIESVVDPDGTLMDYELEETAGVNTVPVLCANLCRSGVKVPFVRDYIILEKTAVDGEGRELPVKVAVIGMAGEYSTSILPERFSAIGYRIVPDYGRINALAAELEASGRCDATLLLTHEDAALAAESLGPDTAIDLVLGGHTHQSTRQRTDWGLPFLEPASNGRAFVRAKLVFSADQGRPVFRGVENAKVIPVNPLPNNEENAPQLDQALAALTDEAVSLIADLLSIEVGCITVSATRHDSLPGSGGRATTAGNWTASILARIVGADVAFANNGGLRVDLRLEPGKDRRPVTRSDVYTMFPFGNAVYLYELTFGELLTALEYALTENGRTLLSQIVGIDVYYTDQTVDTLVTASGQVIYSGGVWEEGWCERTVRVAVSEYVASTDRPDSGLSNPFVAWTGTPRLIEFSKIDNVSAIDVLTAEAEASGGLLAIDPDPHFISHAYSGGDR
ncbi:MAG: 5'-nucleotidase C-terminal domain-containing protein [Clostridia bacterium]|nr:5'-nucleotidase C-terminal domain-containing protein [Clostridia bacterium]